MPDAPAPALLPTTQRLLLSRTATAQRNGRVPSLVTGIVRGGSLVWSTGRGAVDEPHQDVQYRLGSISKTVTAVAVLRLRDEGLLDLDDPLETHLSGTPFGDRTIGQLLSHTAGLRAEAPGPWWERVAGPPWAELATQLEPTDVPHAAGRRFHYSNLGFGALGELLSRHRGSPWAEVVRDEVLLPLGMTRTTPRPGGRAAAGWAVHPWADALLPEPEHEGGGMAPAGQLWATLQDLGRLAGFLLGDTGDVLAPATLDEMTAPAGVDSSAQAWSAYGLGLQVVRNGGATLIGHGGSMPGFLASVFVDRDQDLGTVVLCNATSGLDGTLVGDLHSIVRTAEPRVVAPWTPLPRLDDELLAVVGVWYWGTSAYGLRLRADGLLELTGLAGAGRASRFRSRDDGTFLGLDGYHAGEVLRVVREGARVLALDLGSFVFSRTPYDAQAPHPGGVDEAGWRAAP
ncbi:MAG: Penicillin-binding protein beta-lactamase class [Frankiales bacterium]|jgi:CubicO group peptidase (beta-lactamase class C family)|nr:Penicillin-binding protein beta-lactamase class [Frankiales bacterium]